MSSIAWRALPRSASTIKRSSSFANQRLLVGAHRLRGALNLAVQLLSPLRQMRELALHAHQRRARRFLRAAPRLHLDCDGLRLFAVLLGGGTRSGDAVLMLAPLLVELFARRRQVALAAHCRAALRLALLDRADEGLLLRGQIRDRAVERPGPLPRLIELCATRAELGLRVREQILATRGLGLRLRASFLQPLQLEAGVGLGLRDLVGPARSGLRAFAEAFDLVAAGDDADLRIVAAIHAQPAPADPDSFARDERLAVGEVVAARDRVLDGLGNAHADKKRRDGCRRLHVPEQRVATRRRGRSAIGLDQRQTAFRQIRQRTGNRIDALDAHGLQIGPEHGLDRSFPTGLDDELLSQPAPLIERLRLQPTIDLFGGLAERPFLQRLERREPAAIGLEALAELVEVRGDPLLLLAQLLNLRPNGFQSACGILARGAQPLFLRNQCVEPLLDVGEAQCLPFVVVPLLFLLQPLPLSSELLEARVLDMNRALRGREILADALPLRARLLHGPLGVLEVLLRAALNGVRLLEARLQLAQNALELLELDLIARDVRVDLGDLLIGALQVLGLALDEILTMLQRLLEARDLAADPVVAALHGAEALVAVGELHAQLLDRGFGGTLRRDGGLERDLLLAERMLLLGDFGSQCAQSQREQLGVDLALLGLEVLVALRVLRLLLQMRELLLDLLAEILQTLEILARVPNALLGFPAPLLVLGDAGRFLEKRAKLLGLGLDEPRNHALLDDRVAVRPDAGAEQNVRDVFAAAARVVQVVLRRAVARNDAANGDLVIAGEGARDRAVGIIERELDARDADGLSIRGAVEDDVDHRVAAQRLRGRFAEHPANRIDDVGFAAAVWPHDSHQIAREFDRGRIDECFEARKLDLTQAQWITPWWSSVSSAAWLPRRR